MKSKGIRKIISIVLSFNLLIQSLAPYLIMPVYADESTPSASTQEITPEITPEVTPSIEAPAESTSTQTDVIATDSAVTPVVTVAPTVEINPTEAVSVPPTPSSDNGSQAPPQEENQQFSSAPETVSSDTSVKIPETITTASNLEQAQLPAPTLTSDKTDYFPTDTAYISGSFFLPSTSYTLQIFSNDDPAVFFPTQITTDEAGKFTYAYQLDGHYRPNYTVEAYDTAEKLVASYEFTDGKPEENPELNLISVTELTDGSLTGQRKDGSWVNGNLCSGNGDCYSEGDLVPHRESFNNLDSGNYSFKISHDYQCKNDGTLGYVNFESVNSISNAENLTLSLVDSSNQNKHIWEVTFSVTGNNKDVIVEWNAKLSDQAGGCTGSNLHSYNEGGGNESVQLPVGDINILGSITPTKSSNNSANPSEWTFNITGNTNINGIVSGGTASNLSLGTNNADTTYTITEVGPANWVLDSVSSPCIKTSDSTATVVISKTSPDVACTFVNKQINNASITIVKDADPNDGQDFAFTATDSGLTSFSLDDDPDSTLSNSKKFEKLAAGTYSVTETPVAGWTQTSATCSDGSNPSSINLSSGENVTCTFVNTKLSLNVIKTANPTTLPESGGDVVYTVRVENPNAVSVNLTSLTDDIFGNLNTQGTCSVSQSISSGDFYECSFTKTISSDAGTTHTNVVTAVASGVEDSDDATVSFTNVDPTVELTKSVDLNTLPEPGGTFTFTLNIKNTSFETVTITSLTDSYSLPTACIGLVGTTISAGDTATCSYTVSKSTVGTYNNTATVEVTDLDGSSATDSDSKSISVTNIDPTISVNKTASISTIGEPGGEIIYTFSVTNTSSVDAVTVTKLYDNKFGDLTGDSDCQLGTVLATGASCDFTLTQSLLFDAGAISGYIHTNTFTAEAKDDEDNIATDSDDETVTITDVKPTVTLEKSVTPSELNEPGGVFTYTLTIKNTSVEDVKITDLTDTNSLSAECTDLIGDTLTPNQTVTCSYTISKSESGVYDNTASVEVTDNETNQATATDSVRVTVNDVKPSLTVNKSANVSSVNYPGSNVTFTYSVNNTSTESVTITSISDDKFSITGSDTCKVGTVLSAGESCTFSETHYVSGPVETSHTNTFTVYVEDNEENSASASDYETIRINFVPVSISGQKFNDYNGNGSKDQGELGLAGWTINLQNTNNEVIATATTDADGNYIFSNLNSGTYRLRETDQTGWKQITANPSDITVESGKNITDINFGNRMVGKITIIKEVNSINAEAQDFDFSSSLGGFSLDDDSSSDLSDTKTYLNVGSGSYTFTESETSHWKLTSLNCYGDSDSSVNLSNREVTLTVNNPNEEIVCTFTNTKLGSISGYKYNDLNGDGDKDEAEPSLNGWTFKLYDAEDNEIASNVSGSGSVLGQYKFDNLLPGSYKICEVLQDGWIQTDPGITCRTRTLRAGDSIYSVNFGNFQKAKITVHKNVLGTNGISDPADNTGFKVKINSGNEKTVSETASAVYENLTPGSYTISESDIPSGYSLVSITNDGVVNVTSGGDHHVYIVNKQLPASLTVIKKVINTYGGEKSSSDFTINVTGTNVSDDSFLGSETGTTITLDAGSYSVDEIEDDRYTKTLGKGCSGTINFGESNTCTVTNTRNNGTINIVKNTINPAETDFDFTSNLPEKSNFSLAGYDDGEGSNELSITVPTGSYWVTEGTKTGWALTDLSCDSEGSEVDLTSRKASINLEKDETVTCTFENSELSKVRVIKYHDLDGNGVFDRESDETTLDGWTINLSGNGSKVTSDGEVTFENLPAGTYTLSEKLEEGWRQTNITCDNQSRSEENQYLDGQYRLRTRLVQTVTCEIGNTRIDPKLTISRQNNASGPLKPGDTVEHTITIKVEDNSVANLKLADLLPAGFTFSGSYSVVKNGTTSVSLAKSPEYHSPGIWELGNFDKGDVVTVKYLAHISTAVDPGTFNDLAWASADDAYGQKLSFYAAGEASPFVSGNYVGTDVEVVKEQTYSTDYNVEKKEEKKGEVLGATTLPATGANELWIIAGLISLAFGIKLLKSK